MAPSFEFGNGIFMAAFKRWNKQDQEEARKIELAAAQAKIPTQSVEVKIKKKVNNNCIVDNTEKSQIS